MAPREPEQILVVGASGFVGPYLCQELRATYPQARIAGAGHQDGAPEWIEALRAEWSVCDVTDPESCARLVAGARPSHIVHLAAQSHVPTAQADPVGTWTVNATGTLHILEAVRAEAPRAAFVFVGTGDAYGRSFQPGRPVDEDTPLAPANPYSASKAAADVLVRQYGYQGLSTVCLRAFNHVGPGQRPDFVVSAFARQIADIEAGRQAPVIRVGNLEAWRDFLDVRDVARAYTAVLERAHDIEPGSVFNVCSGQPRQIRQLLEDLLAASDEEISVEKDPDRLRPSDTPFAAGDPSRLRSECGWEPEIPWERTIRDTLDYWRRAASETA